MVVDRFVIAKLDLDRLQESLRLAFKLGNGRLLVVNEGGKQLVFSQTYFCQTCEVEVHPPEQSRFSYNHPHGACGTCQGFGRVQAIDWAKVIPDMSQSLGSKGVKAFNFGTHVEIYPRFYRSAKKAGIDRDKPFAQYTKKEWKWLCEGDGNQFGGIQDYFNWLERKKYKTHYRIHLARFQHYPTCTACHGKRYNGSIRSYRVQEKNLVEVSEMTIESIALWVAKINKSVGSPRKKDMVAVKEVLQEAVTRLRVLQQIGLGYLSLDRVADTLSGGEAQRIGVARCLGSQLTDTLYCLDEPTCGLHARDSKVLLGLLKELRDQGNTVVVVEHDAEIIQGADRVITIGPGAGHLGGTLLGKRALSTQQKVVRPQKAKKANEKISQEDFITVRDISIHNLKNIEVRFPRGKITAVCGVSGSGKTSLVLHSIFPLLSQFFEEASTSKKTELGVIEKKILKKHSGVFHVSQAPLTGSSRSNICTYLGLFDTIRKLFASQELAKQLKLKPGAFSFNSPGGRCENCKGMGYVLQDLSFLGEMPSTCSVCQGRRFDENVLSVRYKGHNLTSLLALTVAEAAELFFDHKAIRKTLEDVMSVGLGYVPIGQSTTSFSGGEGQRLKLLALLREARKQKGAHPMILIFDEPTTGLADSDVDTLMKVFQNLTDERHTVVVVEHHLRVIKSADWLIEIGPGAAADGGRVVYQGPPAGLKAVTESPTGPFI